MMYLAALLALGSASTQAQPAATAQIQPAADTAEHRQALRNLSMCIARTRTRWASQTLAQPYLSEAQASLASRALAGRDNCVTDAEADMRFRTSTLVGSLAEHFISTQTDRNAFVRAARALNTATPLNASEDFAMCVAARDPQAARDLALSEPGSADEARSAERLAAHVAPCTRPGEGLTVDLQSLRALTATALYRALSATTLVARN